MAEGLNLGGLPLGGQLPFRLLRAADDLARVTLALKIGGHLGQLPVYGPLAPALRGIPPCGKGRDATPAADTNLIENQAGFVGLSPGRRHKIIPFSGPVC
ncbi:hypothetical protein CE91St41_01250 [Oscillospiraceae bacterium]|nr:hypothetical protein CE91St40_01250 [Oscillospiraceae bacterium]BDF73236.1 hypothetical protein CE91St41_01250 [Oscillospiraceae bacterium]